MHIRSKPSLINLQKEDVMLNSAPFGKSGLGFTCALTVSEDVPVVNTSSMIFSTSPNFQQMVKDMSTVYLVLHTSLYLLPGVITSVFLHFFLRLSNMLLSGLLSDV